MEQTTWRRPGVKHISLRKITKYEPGFTQFRRGFVGVLAVVWLELNEQDRWISQ